MARFASTEAARTKSQSLQSVITIISYACNCHNRWRKLAAWTENGQFLGTHNEDMIDFLGIYCTRKKWDELFALN